MSKQKKKILFAVLASGSTIAMIPSITQCNNSPTPEPGKVSVTLTAASDKDVSIATYNIVQHKDSTITLNIPDGKEIKTSIVEIDNVTLTKDTDYTIDKNVIHINGDKVNGTTIKLTINLSVQDYIELTATSITLTVGEEGTLKVKKQYPTTGTVTWKVTPESQTFITFDSSTGKIEALAKGEASIVATLGTASATCTVKVQDTISSDILVDDDGNTYNNVQNLYSISDPIVATSMATNQVVTIQRADFNWTVILNDNTTFIPNNFLRNCKSFNKPFTIPSNVTTIGDCFLMGTSVFNQTLTLPNVLKQIGAGFLWQASSFNKPLIIPGTTTSISASFLAICTAFASTITIGENSQLENFAGFTTVADKTFALDKSGITYENGLMYNTNNKTVLGTNTSFTGQVPEGCIKIGDNFLANKTSFNSPVSIPNTVTSIGEYFMSGCTSFNQPLTLPNSVQKIGSSFLYGCTAFDSAITLSTSLESIPDSFLAACTSFNKPITIPDSVESIGNKFLWIAYGKTPVFNSQITFGNGLKTIGNMFLYNNKAFNQTVTLPNSLTTIDQSFMYGCASFNQPLTLSTSLTELSTYFLANCTAYNQPLTLPEGIKSIDGYFLLSCKQFNQPIVLPSTLTNMGNSFMNTCSNFNQPITIPSALTSIAQSCFGATNLGSITISANSQLKNFSSFATLSNKTFILDGSGITYENGLMYNANTKSALGATAAFDGNIPSGCENIGDYFLFNLTAYNNSIAIPNTVKTIGSHFLANGTSFNQKLTIPNSVTSIGSNFLYYCKVFNQTLTLSSSLTSIGNDFMTGCSSFNQPIAIPNSVTTIGQYFMRSCTAFNSSITLSNNMTKIDDYFLQYTTVFNQPLTIPSGVTSIGTYFLSNAIAFNQEVVIPSGVTSIGLSFMSNCTGFNSIINFTNISDPMNFTIVKTMAGNVPTTNTIVFKVAAGTSDIWKSKIEIATGKTLSTTSWTIVEA